MRREGFELTVGKPKVVTQTVNGKIHEPIERMAIDVPEDYLGTVTQLMALRKGRMEQMINHGTGWVRLEYLVPARGLIGFRTEFMTETRGSGIMHSVFERYEPWQGDIKTRASGSLVADRSGKTASFAIMRMQERGGLFVGPGEEVYEGMIVGSNARADDLDVNAVREKKQTNIRVGQRRRHGQHRACDAPVAGPGTGVHPSRRVRRGHPRERAAAEGPAHRDRPRQSEPQRREDDRLTDGRLRA